MFWRLINSKKGKSRTKCKQIIYQGKVATLPQEVSETWGSYFSNLYTKAFDINFDPAFKRSVELHLAKFEVETWTKFQPVLDKVICYDEVLSAMKQLKCGKSPGHDKVMNEHLIYGGPILCNCLCHLFQMMQHLEKKPLDMVLGILIVLLKNSMKSHKDPDNYRGITLLTSILKIYERVLLNRLMQWKDQNSIDIPDEQQIAYQKLMSNINTSFNMQECIYYNLEREAKVFAGYLDSSKAFDFVWIDGLFYKLYKLGIQGKFWRCLRDLYKNMYSAVRVNGIVSEKFEVQQSVRQGGVISPWLYLIYVNDLIVQLRKSDLGADIGSTYAGSPFHADDIALLSLTQDGLQNMMNICLRYSRQWRFKINPNKSTIIVFGETKNEHKKGQTQRNWTIGNQKLTESIEHTHVGITMNKFQNYKDRTKNACSKARKTLMSLIGCGIKENGLTPLTAIRLYQTIVLPRALHGCELWSNLSQNNVMELERIHRFCLKKIQHFPRQTRTDKVLGMSGFKSLKNHIDQAKLIFLGRLCNLPNKNLSKKLFILRLFMCIHNCTKKQYGFIPDICVVLDRYGLYGFLTEFISSGTFPGKDIWKKYVKNAISCYENDKYVSRIMEHHEFDYFKKIQPCLTVPSRVWTVAKHFPQWSVEMFSLAKAVVLMRDCVNVKNCHKCGIPVSNGNFLTHAAESCIFTEGDRNKMWDQITNRLCVQTSAFLNGLDPSDFTCILLGAPIDITEYGITQNEYFRLLHISALFWHRCGYLDQDLE